VDVPVTRRVHWVKVVVCEKTLDLVGSAAAEMRREPARNGVAALGPST
jgi:hypothetical protein